VHGQPSTIAECSGALGVGCGHAPWLLGIILSSTLVSGEFTTVWGCTPGYRLCSSPDSQSRLRAPRLVVTCLTASAADCKLGLYCMLEAGALDVPWPAGYSCPAEQRPWRTPGHRKNTNKTANSVGHTKKDSALGYACVVLLLLGACQLCPVKCCGISTMQACICILS
jgi:hypothetical protein